MVDCSPAAVARARHIVDSLPSKASGAYSHSKGVRVCREAVAVGIEARDGYPSDPENIFLTDGASSAVGNRPSTFNELFAAARVMTRPHVVHVVHVVCR